MATRDNTKLEETDSLLGGEHQKQSFLKKNKQNVILFGVLVTRILFSICNRVAYKIMLVPMQGYGYFISNFAAMCYVVVYFPMLFTAYFMGKVTTKGILSDECLGVKQKKLVILGISDSLGNILGLVSASYIPGNVIPIIAQCVIPFTMICSYFLLKSRYNLWQVVYAIIVIEGVAIALVPQFGNISKPSASGEFPVLFYVAIYIVGLIPNAISFTVKEMIFTEQKDLNIFVVNSFSSLWQLLFTVLFLPIVSIPGFSPDTKSFSELPNFVRVAANCFIGNTLDPNRAALNSCTPMPWPAVVYMCFNIGQNIFMLIVVKYGSAVLNFVTGAVALVGQHFAFSVQWVHFLKPDQIAMPWDIIGLYATLVGMVGYRHATNEKNKLDKEKKKQEQLKNDKVVNK